MQFSIIVPIYNTERYLEDCINSILMQEFREFELILVDDGSTDGSGCICDKYAEKDSRVVVIHKENGGMSHARNCGIRNAKGKYVLFLDSDDWIISVDFLKDIDKHIYKNQADLIQYKSQKYFENTQKMKECTYEYTEHDEIVSTARVINEMVCNNSFFCAAWLKCVKRELLVDNGILFYPGITGEDQEWFLHLLSIPLKIEVINRSYVCYRQREGSISRIKDAKVLKDLVFVLSKWSMYYKDNLCNDIEKSVAVLSGVSRLYSNAIISAATLNKFVDKSIINELGSLNFLVSYAKDKRSKIMAIMIRTLGVTFTIKVLSVVLSFKQ